MRSHFGNMGFRNIRIFDITAAILLNFVHFGRTSDHILSCKVNTLGYCGENQYCDEETSQCQCDTGYTLVEDACQLESPDSITHHATAAIIAVFTLALVICGLVLVIRKYNLIEYVRQKVILRRNNDIMYEDVMIGQDDPPLTP